MKTYFWKGKDCETNRLRKGIVKAKNTYEAYLLVNMTYELYDIAFER